MPHADSAKQQTKLQNKYVIGGWLTLTEVHYIPTSHTSQTVEK